MTVATIISNHVSTLVVLCSFCLFVFLVNDDNPLGSVYMDRGVNRLITSSAWSRTGVPNRGPSGPPGGHGTLKGGHGYKIEFWGAMEDFRGATA